ncbi:nucleotidyltransferase family protein [Singulisphaera acidiphila]|uniref:Uncharacterized protein n=1 Tax=Singulisphaera acidiphila (strain ATCC BAA-1392 / DSM 18658 / VKM B-2454 / MOB10) TaxID=886293 RepID=L0D6Y5_SINAD|nr:nucleotidyl transferase AbiEii/AbiGii toxin family protein [Singulisphaera acidiphila]AGA24598.1 protein of unknown function (DUF1814) [Singulisphaera acidiphila DSM 18658]
MPTYEQRLNQDWGWALSEGSRHFEEKSAVQDALLKIAHRLTVLGVPYAIAGGMALFKHGFRRFTEDVDILVTREGLKTIHERLEGLGYVPPFPGSKNLRDAEHGVRIEFLIAGDYPGDGKPKPVAFPDPTEARIEFAGVSYLDLPKLVELKLASGMTGGVARLKDFADVVALIQTRQLPTEFAASLNPYVRERFLELWNGLQETPYEP